MSSPAPVQIEYAPPLPWHRTALARRILCYIVAAIVLVTGYIYWPWIKQLGPRIYWERKCLNYRAPSGTISYSNDPADIAMLKSVSGYETNLPAWSSGPYVVAPNDTFQRLCGGQPGYQFAARPAIFLHGRRTPSGVQRLVAVQVSAMATPDQFNRLFLFPYVHHTVFGRSSPSGKNSGQLEMFLAPTDRVRLYDGQPDPTDETHFTIDYDLNGQRGTVDGKLANDGTATLTPRTGKLSVSGRTSRWSPGRAALPQWPSGMLTPVTTQTTR